MFKYNIWNISKQYTFLAVILASTTLRAGEKCQQKNIQSFIHGSQQLRPETEALALDYAQCGGRSTKQQVVFWGIFFLDLTDQTTGARKLIEKAFPWRSKQKAAGDLMYQAQIGKPDGLFDALMKNLPEYQDKPEAWLTCAQGFNYSRRFEKAQTAYERYLALVPNDDQAEIEYLFALIWAEAYEDASARITKLRTYENAPYLQKSIEHAENLIEWQRRSKGLVRRTATKVLSGQLAARFSSLTFDEGSFMQGSHLLYQDKVGVELIHRKFQSHLDGLNQEGLEAIVSTRTGVSGLQFAGELGFFSEIDQNLYGALSIGHFRQNYSISLALDYRPTSLIRPIPEILIDQMTQSAVLTMVYQDLLSYEGRLQREEGFALYETHLIEGFLPISRESIGHGLYLYMPLDFRSNPKANPYFLTRPFSLYTGFGLNYYRSIQNLLRLHVKGSAGLTYRNTREDRTSYSNLLSSRLEVSLIYEASEQLRWTVAGHLNTIEKEEVAAYDEGVNSFSVGLIYEP